MAHDGFLGEFQDLAWPVAHQAAVVTTAAAGGALFDALQVHVQQAPMGVGAGPGSGWEHDAAMGSLLPSRSPSPSSLAAAAVGGGAVTVDAALMEHLASRLGVIVSSSSRYASCYSSPVGSPSKPAHGPFGAPLLVEDATRLSCIAASGGKLSRGVASSQSLLGERATAPSPGATQQHACDKSSRDSPSRKRKAPEGKTKAKEAATTATPNSRERPETRAKKCKLSADANDEEWKPAAGEAGRGNGKVISEPPKDYIHVRARRGQATDSHSLAERVRREKISERMKLLQDLVPGCSKINGKAVMLDEIINYVQSLQRQVEFLSMKLSTVNPRLEIDVNSFVPRDANQPCAPAASSLLPPPSVYWLEDSSPALCYATSQGTAAASAVTTAKSSATPPNFVNHGSPDDSLEGFHKANSQMGSFWEEDDLQSLVLMGFRGNT